MSSLTLQGAALFAFIPLVLILYLQMPLGAAASTCLGLVLMFGHRLIAAPWMTRHATERCLWCGREALAQAQPLRIRSSGAERVLAACGTEHHEKAGRFLTFVERFRIPIGLGIFVPLLTLLLANLAQAAGRPFISHAASVLQFRTVVAITVVGASLGNLAIRRPAGSLTSPFPLHNLFLLGIRRTLWVFRLVGAWWLVSSASAFPGLLG